MRRLLSFFLGALLLGLTAASDTAAATIERDLGLGLTYVRCAQLPADLPTSSKPPHRPLVLDLRFASADAPAAATFAAWLNFRARTDAPITVLLNGETSPLLLRCFRPPIRLAGVLTLGPAAAAISPDVAVEVKPEADRAGYEALTTGTAIDELVARKLTKPRHDEAHLARQHGYADAETNTSEGPDNEPNATSVAPTATSEPVTDLLLTRAVQLHRALLALHRVK